MFRIGLRKAMAGTEEPAGTVREQAAGESPPNLYNGHSIYSIRVFAVKL